MTVEFEMEKRHRGLFSTFPKIQRGINGKHSATDCINEWVNFQELKLRQESKLIWVIETKTIVLIDNVVSTCKEV